MYSDWFLRCENEPNHSLEDLCLKKKKSPVWRKSHGKKIPISEVSRGAQAAIM